MHFKIIGEIKNTETITVGNSIRLNRIYGSTNWRKLKGTCRVKLSDGTILDAEVRWYEGHGVGKNR